MVRAGIRAAVALATLPVRVPLALHRAWTTPYDDDPGWPGVIVLRDESLRRQLVAFTFAGSGPWLGYGPDELPHSPEQLFPRAPV